MRINNSKKNPCRIRGTNEGFAVHAERRDVTYLAIPGDSEEAQSKN